MKILLALKLIFEALSIAIIGTVAFFIFVVIFVLFDQFREGR